MRLPQRTCAPLVLLAALGACADPASPPSGLRLEVVQAPPARALPGDRLSDFAIVRAVDADGTPLSGVPVTWSGDGTVTPNADTTGLEGLASASWVLPRYDDETVFKDNEQSGPPGTFELRANVLDEPATTFLVEAKAFTVERLDVGSLVACGIRERALWCWGNPYGSSLPVASGPIPVQATAAGEVTEVAVTPYIVCVLDRQGRASCLSDASQNAFLAVAGVPPLRDLADAEAQVCGIAQADSTAWCWSSRGGQPSGAQQVSASVRFAQLASGDGSSGSPTMCGVDGEGQAWCWGSNFYGQLGNGTTSPSAAPVRVATDVRFRRLVLGTTRTCGLSTSSELWCWGRIDFSESSLVPERVAVPAIQWHAIASGSLLFLTGTRTALWLDGRDPNPISRLLVDYPARALSSSSLDVCAVLTDGQVYCTISLVYGANASTLVDAIVPVPVPGGDRGRP